MRRRGNATAALGMAILLFSTASVRSVDDASARQSGPSWSSPDQIAYGPVAEAPQVALGPGGLAVVVWVSGEPHAVLVKSNEAAVRQARDARAFQSTRVMVAIRKPGEQAFGPPHRLSGAGASRAEVGMSSSGEAIVTWLSKTGGVRASYRRQPGGFTRAERVSVAKASFPDLSVGPDGHAVVAWQTGAARRPAIDVSVRPPGGPFAAPETLAAHGSEPQVAADESDHSLVAWQNGSGNAQASLATGGSFAPAQLIPNSAHANAFPPLELAMHAGHAVVLVDGHHDNALVKASFSKPDGTFSRAVRITRKGQEAEFSRVAMDGHGNATAIWDVFGRGGHAAGAQVSTSPAGGSFGTPETISGPHAGGPLALAVNGHGAAIVAWNALRQQIELRTRFRASSHAAFQPTQNASPQLGDVGISQPGLALDPDGRGAIAWAKSTRRHPFGIGVFVTERP